MGSWGGISDKLMILNLAAFPPITHSPALAGRSISNSDRSSKEKTVQKSLMVKEALDRLPTHENASSVRQERLHPFINCDMLSRRHTQVILGLLIVYNIL